MHASLEIRVYLHGEGCFRRDLNEEEHFLYFAGGKHGRARRGIPRSLKGDGYITRRGVREVHIARKSVGNLPVEKGKAFDMKGAQWRKPRKISSTRSDRKMVDYPREIH